MKLGEIWKTRFKQICQFRKHSPIPRLAINDHKEEVAFRCKFVIEDRIEVVGDRILHPFIYTLNEDAPTNFLGELVIAAEPENERISVCAPKEIVKIQIDGKFICT